MRAPALVPVAGLLLLAAAAHGQDETDQRFRAGMEALDAALAAADREARDGKLDAAIAAFRSILVDRPELVRVRLELARAFFLKEEDALARRHFEQVLAGTPPPAVAANIQRFLSVMRARRRWDAHFGAAVAPNSNLNAASGTQTIWLDTPLGRLPFTLDREVVPKSGLGLLVWGGGEYQHPFADPGAAAGTGAWWLRSGASARLREYKGGEFDRHSVSAHLGPRRILGAGTEVSLLATVSRQWAAGVPEIDRFGLRLEGDHLLTPRLVLFAWANAARRRCRDCDWLDGPVGDVSLGATWVALPILRLDGNAGWRWSRAEAEPWRSRGPRAGLGAVLALPAGFSVGLRVFLQRTDYQGRGSDHHTIDLKPRTDRTRSRSVSVHNRALTLLGFSPRLSLVREERETNAQTLDYRQDRAELSFVRQF